VIGGLGASGLQLHSGAESTRVGWLWIARADIVAISTAHDPGMAHGMNEQAETSPEAALRSEREVLLVYLNHLRDTMVRLTHGLTDEQLRAPGVPSGTSLLGLVHHLTGVEVHWFQRVFLGDEVPVDLSMRVPAGMSRGEVIAAYRQACARSDAIVGDCLDLTQRSAIPNPGEATRDTLRSILVHMVEETARHAGHGDILREQSDGVTGQ
jgi:uncharacterized damage-inducible protein DinB